MGAGGLCYLGESGSSLQSASPPILSTQPWPWLTGTEGLHACLSVPEEGWLVVITSPAWPICHTIGRCNPLVEGILCRSKTNWETQGPAILPQQGLWRKTRSRADRNIMAQRMRKKREGHRVVSARWQQWHVSATCPGEYEPVSLLLFSQCEMTLAPLSACLAHWLTACPSMCLAVC